MSRLRYLVMLAVAVACGIGAISSVERSDLSITHIEPSQETTHLAGPPPGPILPMEPPAGIRKAERSRRAIRPASDSRRVDGLNYESVLNGRDGATSVPKHAEPMPPTDCRSIESVPKSVGAISGPQNVHRSTVYLFEEQSGFGFHRMFWFTNDRGVAVASQDIDRVELVSLLTDDEPSVYVLDEMATPPLARQAIRRPLDEFERLGLNAVRFGEELVWTREAPMRMFGAIRAEANCLHCHANAEKGDLLGAFTYYLKVPVDRGAELGKRW
jgi:hypothetical protein